MGFSLYLSDLLLTIINQEILTKMRSDLQELEITLGELKRLTGLNCFVTGGTMIFMSKSSRFGLGCLWGFSI